MKKELRELLDKHTAVAELLNGQKGVKLTAEEQEKFHEYMVIRAEVEHRERELFYYYGHDLPMWLQRYWEKIQNECFVSLREECNQYIDLHVQYERMQDEHDFLAKIIDRDAITEPFALEEADVKLLAEFLEIMSDKREIEEMKMYVMGCRDAYRLLRGMNIIEKVHSWLLKGDQLFFSQND